MYSVISDPKNGVKTGQITLANNLFLKPEVQRHKLQRSENDYFYCYYWKVNIFNEEPNMKDTIFPGCYMFVLHCYLVTFPKWGRGGDKMFLSLFYQRLLSPTSPVWTTYGQHSSSFFMELAGKHQCLTVIPKSHPILLFTSLQIRSIDTEMLVWLLFLLTASFCSPGHVPSVRWSNRELL